MKFPIIGRINSNGNFDRRYATGIGRTYRQRNADILKTFYPKRVSLVNKVPRIKSPRIY